MYPDDLKYTKDHEWVRLDGNIAEIGLTVFAEEALGDVVFVDLPDVGTDLGQFEKFGEIESVKAVSDLMSPVRGKIVEVNTGPIDSPEIVNEDPYGSGWLIRVEVTDPSQLDELMDAETYKSTLE
ncbi:MAG: glycine cleavage system protein GcvH [Dehalococcoidia bacterium]|jgi:glycine cleavage system H protein|nr:glycine cleavage system protein GcvH [Dehalococcoidia bacterium]|tara:strand:- start:137 stop:511 length:375 start_codon:yes stop_codon:yes gene_type:complete